MEPNGVRRRAPAAADLRQRPPSPLLTPPQPHPRTRNNAIYRCGVEKAIITVRAHEPCELALTIPEADPERFTLSVSRFVSFWQSPVHLLTVSFAQVLWSSPWNS